MVMTRAEKPNEQSAGLFGDMRYDYHAFVTNIGEHELQNEKLIEFYRSRSDVENLILIKDMKHGFDLKHLPCLSLLANKAYALLNYPRRSSPSDPRTKVGARACASRRQNRRSGMQVGIGASYPR